jgi:hypothetical protein
MSINEIKGKCRDASVWLKIGAGIFGFTAACLWYLSADSAIPADAASHNLRAALVTGVSMFFQATAALIDAWIAPTATWK